MSKKVNSINSKFDPAFLSKLNNMYSFKNNSSNHMKTMGTVSGITSFPTRKIIPPKNIVLETEQKHIEKSIEQSVKKNTKRTNNSTQITKLIETPNEILNVENSPKYTKYCNYNPKQSYYPKSPYPYQLNKPYDTHSYINCHVFRKDELSLFLNHCFKHTKLFLDTHNEFLLNKKCEQPITKEIKKSSTIIFSAFIGGLFAISVQWFYYYWTRR